MNYILFDDQDRDYLLPLTYMRPCANIRCGILTIREKWEYFIGTQTFTLTQKYLSKHFSLKLESDNIFLNGLVMPEDILIEAIYKLEQGQALVSENGHFPIAFRCSNADFHTLGFDTLNSINIDDLQHFKLFTFEHPVSKISRPWHIFAMNADAIRSDYKLITAGKISAKISETNRYFHPERIFIEEGAIVECSVLNATDGPIYIGKKAEIMENSAIRGPFALGEHSVVKMGAKIYGATTIGPQCKVGGEVSNSVFFANSNKAHDGFIGNSVIAEWCNLGADTNNSNLKNTYDIVKIWLYPEKKFVTTGLQFCGLIMGDHSKSGINTMFNTGTVVGINSNIFGEGFPRNFIPSFSWGGAQGFKKYDLRKAIEVARAVMSRRGVILSEIDIELFETLFNLAE